MNLWLEEPTHSGDLTAFNAVLETDAGERLAYRIQVPTKWTDAVKTSCDAFLLLVLFQTFRHGGRLRVRGCVSPSLIQNLEEFQSAWCSWCRDDYRRVDIEPDEARESPPAPPGRVLMPFSGGLDSCFSVITNVNRDRTLSNPPSRVAMMVHGFDIPLSDPPGFSRALEHARAILDDVGIECIPLVTNVRDYGDRWNDSHGAAIAACLHFLGRGFGQGIVASSHTYTTLRFPWGSNPLTDPMLSSATMHIGNDDLTSSRSDKAAQVAKWPAATEHLRVCWKNQTVWENCGECSNCLGTALCFAASGAAIPERLNVPSAEAAVAKLRVMPLDLVECARVCDTILSQAWKHGLTASWVGELERLIVRKRRRLSFQSLLEGLSKGGRIRGR